MEFGKSKRRHREDYSMGKENIDKKKEEKKIAKTIKDNMSPEKHMNKIIGDTYNLFRNIRGNFTYVDEDMIQKLITTFYAATVWSPSKKKNT